jgi:hypothetical protein
MTLGEALISVWHQVLEEGREAVELEGERFSVVRTRAKSCAPSHSSSASIAWKASSRTR